MALDQAADGFMAAKPFIPAPRRFGSFLFL
jgi:hypothetical protein